MTEELKPCPFCRCTPLIIDEDEFSGGGDRYDDIPPAVSVMCAMRGLGAARGCGASSGFHGTKEMAVAAWNRRAAPSQPEGAEPVAIDRELLAAIQAYRERNSALLMAQAIALGATPEKGVTIPIDPRIATTWNLAVEAQKRLYDLTDARMAAGAAAPDEGEAAVRVPKKPTKRPMCRDCAEFGPICPGTGERCDGLPLPSAPKGEEPQS